MQTRYEAAPEEPTLEFLKRCFRFVNQEWPHTVRVETPDEGFEEKFRESCERLLPGWSVAPVREMRLGAWRDTLSGTLHEIDIAASASGATAVAELKNRGGSPGKNDIIVFYAKILDYMLANPDLASEEICLAFMSTTSFDDRGLAACLGLGIHPVSSDIRPLPVLVDNAKLMQNKLDSGLQLTVHTLTRFEYFRDNLNRIAYGLQETWPNYRCSYEPSYDCLQLQASNLLMQTIWHESFDKPTAIGWQSTKTTYMSEREGVDEMNINSYNITDITYHYIGLRVLAGMPLLLSALNSWKL